MMKVLNGKLVLATALSVLVAGCGGSSDSAPKEGDVTAAATEVVDEATDATSDAADAASGAVEKAGELVSDAADSASDLASDATEKAGELTSGAAESAGDLASGAVDSVKSAAEGLGWTNLQENWSDSIGSIKDRWSDLTEEDLLGVDGNWDALVTLVQEKYGIARDIAEAQVTEWAAALK